MSTLTDQLIRWMAMDFALTTDPGLNVKEFAKAWGVSERTVHRDLKAFVDLGQHIDVKANDEEWGRYFHRYDLDEYTGLPCPLFRSSMSDMDPHTYSQCEDDEMYLHPKAFRRWATNHL